MGESEQLENMKTLDSEKKLYTLYMCWGDKDGKGFLPLWIL